jgi:GTPase SAR1 family protein
MQVREALVGHTSVLAGPSGVGKSSIINALRAEAFDDAQRARLAAFERKMQEEHTFWRQYHEGPDEDDEDPEHEGASSALEEEAAADGAHAHSQQPTGARFLGGEV